MPTSRGFNTTGEQRIAWARYRCRPDRMGRMEFPAAGAIGRDTVLLAVAEECESAFSVLATLMRRHKVTFNEWAGGTYNCRKITGGSGYSLHAYGIALDVNPSQNPYGPRLVSKFSAGFINDVLKVRTNNNRRVFRWGGDWDADPTTGHSNYDAMHFEITCGPADLKAGINPATVIGTNPTEPSHPPTTGNGDPMLPLEKNQDSTDVAFLQVMLVTISPKIVLVDGKYGDATARAIQTVLSRPSPVTRVFAGDYHALMTHYIAAIRANHIKAAETRAINTAKANTSSQVNAVEKSLAASIKSVSTTAVNASARANHVSDTFDSHIANDPHGEVDPENLAALVNEVMAGARVESKLIIHSG